MKHLKTINELFKSTYISAADKLKSKDRHTGRAEELIKHAAKMGEDTPHERVWPFRFIFPDSLENEFYSIQSVKESRNDYNSFVQINFKSNYGKDKKMELHFYVYVPSGFSRQNPQFQGTMTSQDDDCKYRLNVKSDTGFKHPDNRIARKNALEFYKFFLEYWEDELSEKYPNFILEDFTVNNLYRT